MIESIISSFENLSTTTINVLWICVVPGLIFVTLASAMYQVTKVFDDSTIADMQRSRPVRGNTVNFNEYAKTFRWLYAAVVEIAKNELAKEVESSGVGNWPVTDDWSALGPTSKSTFLRRARERLGIPHGEFLSIVREGRVDVDDLFYS